MPRTGRPTPPLVLTDDERATLTRWSRRAKSSQVLAMRSRIILACADGAPNTEVATALVSICPLWENGGGAFCSYGWTV